MARVEPAHRAAATVIVTGQAPGAATPEEFDGTESDAEATLPPRHVAVIMDGNRRWARHRGLPEAEGHAAGVEAIRPLLRRATERGVAVLSLYAFSRENWARSPDEVQTLFGLLESAIRDETPELVRQGVRVRILGRMDELPEATRSSIEEALAATANGSRMTLNVAFNYSGRSEIVDAARRCIADGLPAERLDEAAIAARLYTADLPEPDLLIRTGGDLRISNFLIWQAAYAELYFTERLWPDFDPDAFEEALAEYARRSRRFGR
ncbi:MAG: polyprenyl diphosphate synthase [Candidatus Limnocylindrales bacterium]